MQSFVSVKQMSEMEQIEIDVTATQIRRRGFIQAVILSRGQKADYGLLFPLMLYQLIIGSPENQYEDKGISGIIAMPGGQLTNSYPQFI